MRLDAVAILIDMRDMKVSRLIRCGDAISVYSDELLSLSFSSLPPSPLVDGVGTSPDLCVVLFFNRCKWNTVLRDELR